MLGAAKGQIWTPLGACGEPGVGCLCGVASACQAWGSSGQTWGPSEPPHQTLSRAAPSREKY